MRNVAGDPENDRFEIEFETLNWSDREVFGLYLARNQGSGFGTLAQSAPFFASASIDSNGRPLGPADDDANLPPADGTGPGSFPGQANTWTVTTSDSNAVFYQEPSAVPGNGLVGLDILSIGARLIPGCTREIGDVARLANPETVDNSGALSGPLADNALDGFVLDVDDFDEGEILSFNWFLVDQSGNPVGVSGLGNVFGFGVVNISRGSAPGPPVWERSPDALEGPGANSGTSNSLLDMFQDSTAQGEEFRSEFGSQITAPFMDPSDNIFGASVNGQIFTPPAVDVPVTSPIGFSFLLILILVVALSKVRETG